MRDGRERKEGALVVVGHGGLTSDEVATARKSRKRPHQRLTGCVEATTSKRRSRRSLELAGQRVFAKTRELGEGEAPAAMAGGFGLCCGRREKQLGLATRSGRRGVASRRGWPCQGAHGAWPARLGERRRVVPCGQQLLNWSAMTVTDRFLKTVIQSSSTMTDSAG